MMHLKPNFLPSSLAFCVAMAMSLPAMAQSNDAISANIKTSVETWLAGKYKVEEVRKSPMPNMYEVRIGSDIIYVDEKGNFAFVEGQLIDIKTSRNLTDRKSVV